LTSRAGTLSNRAKNIYQEEGLLAAIKRVFTFLISPILDEYNDFYVYVLSLREGNEVDYLPKIQNSTHRIVETIEQLDELSNTGFDLSLIDIDQYRYRLDKGATLSLLFVDRELGYTGWAVLTEEAKNTFNRYPYKVDFENNEICRGASWTNPKYRRQGLSYYSSYKEEQFLIGKGANKSRAIVLSNNIASQNGNDKAGSKLVAKARYFRIFGLQFWRERPVKSTDDEGDQI
jgi:hypothetical protein